MVVVDLEKEEDQTKIGKILITLTLAMGILVMGFTIQMGLLLQLIFMDQEAQLSI